MESRLSQKEIDALLDDVVDEETSKPKVDLPQKNKRNFEPLSQEEIDALLDVVDEDEEEICIDEEDTLNYEFFLESNLIKHIYKNSGNVFYNSNTEATGDFLIEIDGQIKQKNVKELFFDCKEYLAQNTYWCVSLTKNNQGLAKLKWVLPDSEEEEQESGYIKEENEIKAVLKLTFIFVNDIGYLMFH